MLGFQAGHYPLADGESVLDCLLRHQQPVPYSCKAGLCQSCLVQAVDCQPPALATRGLKATLQSSGHAMACQWHPDSDVCVRLPDNQALSVQGHIVGLQQLNAVVMKLVVQAEDPTALAECHPGQYLNLVNSAGTIRSYSVANDCRQHGRAEFHIAATAQGLFSHWLFNAASLGDVLQMRGPAGSCFYVADADQQQPLLLVGVGTGLAPLYAIVNDALAQGHQGPILLVHGASSTASLYYRAELRALAASHSKFSYSALVRAGAADADCQQGDAAESALALLAALSVAQTRVYLCGNAAFVHNLRKLVFMRGVRSANIFCDPFVERATQSN